MNDHLDELAKRFFSNTFASLPDAEKRVIRKMAGRLHVSRDTNRIFDEQTTFGQRLADKIAAFGGSWPFIIIFLILLAAWIVTNSLILAQWGKPFDPYPYILLNLFLSTLAAIQAPLILMSQNRQAARDRLDAQHDYEVNLKAELEIMALHQKIDELTSRNHEMLVLLQQIVNGKGSTP